MTTKHTPAYIAYTVDGNGRGAYWTRIGAAWPQRSGEGFSIQLAALPITGRIVLMPPKPAEGESSPEHEPLPADL